MAEELGNQKKEFFMGVFLGLCGNFVASSLFGFLEATTPLKVYAYGALFFACWEIFMYLLAIAIDEIFGIEKSLRIKAVFVLVAILPAVFILWLVTQQF